MTTDHLIKKLITIYKLVLNYSLSTLIIFNVISIFLYQLYHQRIFIFLIDTINRIINFMCNIPYVIPPKTETRRGFNLLFLV